MCRCSIRVAAIEVIDVVQTLERVCRKVGYPKTIRVDQGTEFVSRDLDLWAYAKGATLDFSRPGKQTDNAFILRRSIGAIDSLDRLLSLLTFNGRFRAEGLNQHWLLTLADACEKMEDWPRYYDTIMKKGLMARSATRCRSRW